MNTNLRALVFGAAVALALTVTLDTVTAAEQTRATTAQATRLEAVQVVAHRDHFDADGNVKAIVLEPVVVIAHRSTVG